MSNFILQEKRALELLREHGVLAVVKPPRTGGSINLSKGCIELKLKGIVVTHSIDLIKETKRQVTRLLKHKPKILVIPDNLKLCRRLDSTLRLKFQLKRRCNTCPYNGKPTHCLYQRLLVEQADLYLITYDKLEMLHKTRSARALFHFFFHPAHWMWVTLKGFHLLESDIARTRLVTLPLNDPYGYFDFPHPPTVF
jgi:hypothetical protein